MCGIYECMPSRVRASERRYVRRAFVARIDDIGVCGRMCAGIHEYIATCNRACSSLWRLVGGRVYVYVRTRAHKKEPTYRVKADRHKKERVCALSICYFFVSPMIIRNGISRT